MKMTDTRVTSDARRTAYNDSSRRSFASEADTFTTISTEKFSSAADEHPTPYSSLQRNEGYKEPLQKQHDGRQLESVASDADSMHEKSSGASPDLSVLANKGDPGLDDEQWSLLNERALHESAMSYLRKQRDNLAVDLKAEQNSHQQTRSELVAQKDIAKHQRQLKQNAVGELNRFLRGSQAPNQSPDDIIIGRAMNLRVIVRDFAIRHFEHNGGERRTSHEYSSLKPLQELLLIPQKYLENYIDVSSTRVRLIQAFLWAYLCDRIFDHFRWTRQGTGAAFHKMCTSLDCLKDEKTKVDPEGMRKYYTWKATTATLLLEATRLEDKSASTSGRDPIREWSSNVDRLIRPFMTSHHENYWQGLENLVFTSFELDEEISKQIAFFEWSFHENYSPQLTAPQSIVPVSGQEFRNQNITLVLSPGLFKHGKSSGDDFDVTEKLLKRETYCELPGDMTKDTLSLHHPKKKKGLREDLTSLFNRSAQGDCNSGASNRSKRP